MLHIFGQYIVNVQKKHNKRKILTIFTQIFDGFKIATGNPHPTQLLSFLWIFGENWTNDKLQPPVWKALDPPLNKNVF